MRRMTGVLALLGLGLLAGCGRDASAPGDPQAMADVGADHTLRVTAMTRNMYVGADLDLVLSALTNQDPTDDFAALVNAAQTCVETDYDARVHAIAGEIALKRPMVVGLQEVSTITMDLSEYEVPIVLSSDFLADLQEELAEMGLGYTVGGKVQNMVLTPAPGVTLVDADVILVDPARVAVSGTINRTFRHNVGPVAEGISLVRGWVGVEANIEGQPYVFVSTHLESGNGPGMAALRRAQADEIVSALGQRPRVILMGDFNDVEGSPMYQAILRAGFTDAWTALREDTGNTCCNLPNLANERARYSERIDYVFARGLDMPGRGLMGDIIMVGYLRGDRMAGPMHPIWPSDHAGLMARLRVPFMGDTE